MKNITIIKNKQTESYRGIDDINFESSERFIKIFFSYKSVKHDIVLHKEIFNEKFISEVLKALDFYVSFKTGYSMCTLEIDLDHSKTNIKAEDYDFVEIDYGKRSLKDICNIIGGNNET